MNVDCPDSRLHALILDFDGTLAELCLDFDEMKRRLGALAESYLDAAPAPGARPALEWLDELTGRIAEAEGRDTALEFNSRARFLIMDMELAAARQGRLFPFTRPALAELRAAGLGLAVITRNCSPAVNIVFPDIRDFVDVFLAREDVARTKPDPLHARTALAALDVAPGCALMVGDHPLDMATAHAAGMHAAGVASGRVDEAGLLAAGADLTAPDLPGLLALLRCRNLF
ncbi:HAD-superfamily hydrolase, subfamily IA, variant 3 [Desulfovibrio sp. X2]|uniref:HAD family hydrolase n=1 Tax=Desulfovibrio sp. X2 TaxID=941449 RepID=UPI000358D54E|nr:HAD-IA family hydrolase [Desulfovibrio sp. X2]EPR39785.1 HAD-superfamily hydrolase, subfamily IA, variant 3 [Desulfovibrio sp. X2]